MFKRIDDDTSIKVNDIFDSNLITDRVKELILEELQFNLETYISYISECESPIEQMLSLYLSKYTDTTNRIYLNENFYDLDIIVIKQHQLTLDGVSLRVDFLVQAAILDLNKFVNIVVECDGFEYHHKNKEQIINDNNRDYLLKKNDYEIIRFLGSEIYKDPEECSSKVYNLIKSKFKNLVKN